MTTVDGPLANDTITYQYNELNQIKDLIPQSGQSLSYVYDTIGRLQNINKGTDTFTYGYTGINPLIQTITRPNGSVTEYQYNDSLKKLTAITNKKSTQEIINSFTYEYYTSGASTDLIWKETIENGEPIDTFIAGTTTYTNNNLNQLTSTSNPNRTYTYDDDGNMTTGFTPEGYTLTMAYDAVGNLISKTDATGIASNYVYDSLNRLTSVNFPDATQNVSYTYDSTGKVLSMSDPSGTTAYSYDSGNRLSLETKTIGNINFATAYTYNLSGALTSITYPSGRIVSYEYDPIGRIIKVIEEKDGKRQEIISNITYLPNGAVTAITQGNGIVTSKTYDVKGVLSNLNIGSLKQLSYTRDNIGNITSIIDNLDSSKTKTFAYDAIYRLTNATGPWGTIQYQYDSTGNRTTETSSAGVTSYSYTANKLISSTGAKPFNFSYDNNGNTIAENGKQYIYNQNQRLIKAVENGNTLGEYLYNGNGQRVKKVARGRTTYFIYDQSGNLIEEADEQGQINIDYIYLGSVPIARADEWWEGMKLPDAPTGLTLSPGDTQLTVSWNPDTGTDTVVDRYKVYWGTESSNYTNSVDVGKVTNYTITGLTNGVSYYVAVKAYADIKETYFYHTDHLGTPILMTDKNQSVVWNGEFLPFGEPLSITGNVENNFRFPRQYFDVETGLHQNGFRTYSPSDDRYLEADPIRIDEGANHLFVYASANPVNRIDPLGLYDCTYYITIHRMVCTPNTIPHASFDSTNFLAGNNNITGPLQCQNNPNCAGARNIGPIPPGDYNIGRQRRGSSRRDLTPIGFQNMYGRSAFQIHGCGNQNTCSKGCIAATTNATRDRFNSLMSLEEGNNTLHVVP